jgi:methionyl-tRNA formyltransferase
VKKWGIEHLLPVLEPVDLKSFEFFERLKEKESDLIFSAAYGSYIPTEILHLPKFGSINLHPSLLPLYRGAAPVQRALMSGARESGITLAYMTEKWDQGEILAQKSFPVLEEDDSGTLLEKLAEAGVFLLDQTLPKLFRKEIVPVPQDDSKATYAPALKKEETWIQWGKPAEKIHNQIRGLSPDPGARTLFQGKQIKILKAGVLEEKGLTEFGVRLALLPQMQPGTIIGIEPEGPVVVCGKDLLLILKIQPESRGILSGRDFLNGYRVQILQQFEMEKGFFE